MTQKSHIHIPGYRRDDDGVTLHYPGYGSTHLRVPERPLTILPHTLTEVTGPAYGHGEVGALDNDLTLGHGGEPLGERIIVTGRVLDGDGRPVRNTLIEIWQANASGRYAHPEDDREDLPLDEGFEGFGRFGSDPDGTFSFVTVRPGRVPDPDGDSMQALHIAVSVPARGLLKRLYFPDEVEANAHDPVLLSIEDPELRETLVARDEEDTLRFDIHLQGERQTAFFDV